MVAAEHPAHALYYGQKTYLRPYAAGFSDAEVERIYRWNQDPEVLRWSGGSPLRTTLDEFKKNFQAERNPSDAHRRPFLIFTLDGELIGRTGLFDIDHRRREAELGIVLGEKRYWGQGYGSDALNALLRYVFERTDLDRVYLFTYADNHRAQRAFEKAGFRFVGKHRKFSWELGMHDEFEMEVRRHDWPRLAHAQASTKK